MDFAHDLPAERLVGRIELGWEKGDGRGARAAPGDGRSDDTPVAEPLADGFRVNELGAAATLSKAQFADVRPAPEPLNHEAQ